MDWLQMTFTITGGEAVMMGAYGDCDPSAASGEPTGEPGPATTVFVHLECNSGSWITLLGNNEEFSSCQVEQPNSTGAWCNGDYLEAY